MHGSLRPTIPLAAALLLGSIGYGVTAPPERQDSESRKGLTISTITIVTDRFPEMLEFYRDVVGFQVTRFDQESQFVEFQNERVNFHLTTRATMRYASGSPKFDEKRAGHAFELAFELPDPGRVDQVYARLIEKGATPVAAPTDKPWGQRIAFFADPDGNIHDLYAKL